jgi:Flp pilus assembly protein TadD
VWSAWAAAQLLLSDVAAAQEGFERAGKFLPGHVGTWVALAWCRIMRGDLSGARASLDTALALDRNFAETHGGLAVVAAMQGNESEARNAIERALRLDGTSVSAQYARALLDGQVKDPAAVQALARRLLRAKGGGGVGLLDRRLSKVKNP